MSLRLLLLPVLVLLTAAEPHSGRDDASPAVQAMQDDDAENPAMLWVQQGQALWSDGCARCHGPVAGMRGVATQYPEIDHASSAPITLAGRVNQCRTARMGGSAWGLDSDEMLGVTALIGQQSRGLPLAIDGSGPAAPFVARGRSFFEMRQGQLNLACASCHGGETGPGLAGQRLGGARIPQGQPNGYPLYRLEWQAMGSLDRRLRNCLTGARAEPLAPDSPDMAALQLYLGYRANGLAVETPAVRP